MDVILNIAIWNGPEPLAASIATADVMHSDDDDLLGMILDNPATRYAPDIPPPLNSEPLHFPLPLPADANILQHHQGVLYALRKLGPNYFGYEVDPADQTRYIRYLGRAIVDESGDLKLLGFDFQPVPSHPPSS